MRSTIAHVCPRRPACHTQRATCHARRMRQPVSLSPGGRCDATIILNRPACGTPVEDPATHDLEPKTTSDYRQPSYERVYSPAVLPSLLRGIHWQRSARRPADFMGCCAHRGTRTSNPPTAQQAEGSAAQSTLDLMQHLKRRMHLALRITARGHRHHPLQNRGQPSRPCRWPSIPPPARRYLKPVRRAKARLREAILAADVTRDGAVDTVTADAD